jgi:hypothetical protein
MLKEALVQKSQCTSFPHKREELGNEVVICVASATSYPGISAEALGMRLSHQRITTIGYG